MNKHEVKLLDPCKWFEFTRKQKKIGDILLNSLMNKDMLLKIKNDNEEAIDDFITIFSNAHLHWGLAIENGFKGLIVKHQPSTIKYEIEGDDLIIIHIAGKNHDLHQLATLTGVYKKEFGLYQHKNEYLSLTEVLKHLSGMIRWGARYPLPMNTKTVHKFSPKVPETVVYGFHILDVMQPLFEAFKREDEEVKNSRA